MKAFVLLLSLLIVGCSTSIDDYQGIEPKLDLAEYFQGDIVAHGMFQDYSDKVIRRFRVDIKASWDGNKGVLDEQFYYADGERQTRIWTIIKNGDSYTGTASDVKGEASGKAVGNALQWQYTLLLPFDDDIIEVQFDDWMYLLDEKRMMNRSFMKKFGITVGEVTLFFEKN